MYKAEGILCKVLLQLVERASKGWRDETLIINSLYGIPSEKFETRSKTTCSLRIGSFLILN